MSTACPRRWAGGRAGALLLLGALVGGLLAGPLAVGPAAALEEDLRQSAHIQADRAELDEGAATGVYSGHVRYRQGSIRLEADRLTLRADPAAGVLREAVAEGRPARFRQLVEGETGPEELRGRARRISYRAAPEEVVILEGDALLEQGERRLQGERIVYRVAAQAVEATGGAGGRVEVVLPAPAAAPPSRGPAGRRGAGGGGGR